MRHLQGWSQRLSSLDLSTLSLNELSEQLMERSLSCVGSKPELVARLWEVVAREGWPDMEEEAITIYHGRGLNSPMQRKEVILPVERTMRVAKVNTLFLSLPMLIFSLHSCTNYTESGRERGMRTLSAAG